MNARMSEFHAIVALESLQSLNKNLNKRNALARYYKMKLSNISNIEYQTIRNNCITSYKDFSIIVIDKKNKSRDAIERYLMKNNIISKKYFYPPLHLQKTYSKYKKKYKLLLPNTKFVSKNVLSLPMYSHMSKNDIDTVTNSINNFYNDR